MRKYDFIPNGPISSSYIGHLSRMVNDWNGRHFLLFVSSMMIIKIISDQNSEEGN